MSVWNIMPRGNKKLATVSQARQTIQETQISELINPYYFISLVRFCNIFGHFWNNL